METVKTQGFSENYIYSGEEIIRFDKRHPIYKTLMKLEFEEALRTFQLNRSGYSLEDFLDFDNIDSVVIK